TSGRVDGPRNNLKWVGGSGGSPQEKSCPPGEAITAIGVSHTRDGTTPKFVNSIDLYCNNRMRNSGCIDTGEGCSFYDLRHGYEILRCGPGELAVGFKGRSGIFIDAIGLFCLRAPATPPRTTPRS